ncbi:hypothetical protein V491_03091 [Pseudogymnoascus sp. VKM F-3775]|nr:hypothetical protein V491_03091 [Pseudogymnoascus sp. VKM F-3775]
MATANTVYKALNEIVLNPKYADLFAIVKAARNGAHDLSLSLWNIQRKGSASLQSHAHTRPKPGPICAQPAHGQSVERQPADRDIYLRTSGAGAGEAERGAEHGIRDESAAVE